MNNREPIDFTTASLEWLKWAGESCARLLRRRNAINDRQQAAAMRNKELRAEEAARRERQS